MTFERPFALALCAAVAVAWWIHRSRSGAPVVRVASLLAFRGASASPPSSAPRTALDWRIACVLLAMTFLSLAAAGPAFGARRGEAFFVVVDRSASMTSRTCDAPARAQALLREAAPLAEPIERTLGGPGTRDGLPESLAPLLAEARRLGFPGIVLVTDAPFAEMPGIAVVGPSAGAASNLSIASVVLDGKEAVVALRNHGPRDVVASLRCGGDVREVAVPAGGSGAARFPAPAAGEKGLGRHAEPPRGPATEFAIVLPPDDLAADDRVVVARIGGARRVRLVESPRRTSPRLAAALRAAGAETSDDGPWDAEAGYRVPITAFDERTPRLVVAPDTKLSTGTRPSVVARDAGSPATVRGDTVVGRRAFADVLPSPGATLAADVRLLGGEAVWTDAEGALAAADRGLVVLAADPEDPRSDWHRDPSFPAFVAAALDHLTGGPDRLEAQDPVPSSESDVVHAPPPTSGPDRLRAVLRPAGTEPGASRPARWLALAAALLLAAAALVPRR